MGEHLKNRRLILGLTQKQVPAQLGTIREVYERWERNERQPVVSVWPSMIAFLGFYPGQEDTSIFNLILRVRRISGLDQKELARRVGVAHQKLGGWERGEELPTPGLVRRLADLAGVGDCPIP